MRFYEFEGLIKSQEEAGEGNSKDRRCSRQKIAEATEQINSRLEKIDTYVFICSYDPENEKVRMGVIEKTTGATQENLFKNCLRSIGISAEECTVRETTFETLDLMLCESDRSGFIKDRRKVLNSFELYRLPSGTRYGFRETLLQKVSRERSILSARKKMAKDLIPELERIYEVPGKRCPAGHPVHYLVRSDDSAARDSISKVLLTGLYSNGRIENSRVSWLEIKNNCPDSTFLKELYESNIGGSVVVSYEADIAETGEDRDIRWTSETLADLMREYRNKVLTVVSLPTKEDDVWDNYQAVLGNTGVIEIVDGKNGRDEAIEYFKLMARQQNIRIDKKLLAPLDDEKKYSVKELKEIFEDWYDEKLRAKFYPQYKDVIAAGKKKESYPQAEDVLLQIQKQEDEHAQKSAFDELNELVGLDAAKGTIKKVVDYFQFQSIQNSKGCGKDRVSMHMLFTGNPGTAKTTAARLFARIMKENNCLKNGQFIEVGRSSIVGKYVGHTAVKVKELFEKAKGGVLFIDEAYSLVDDRDNSFGDEAINTIVQEMENHREDVCVIFAGYPGPMNEFLEKNPGLRSRIAFHISFDDYSDEELCRIADLLAEKSGMRYAEDVRRKLKGIFAQARTEKGFGNGRYVRNVMEQAKLAHASRLMKLKNPEDLTEEQLTTLTAEDIEPVDYPETPAKHQIGFVA